MASIQQERCPESRRCVSKISQNELRIEPMDGSSHSQTVEKLQYTSVDGVID